MNGPTGLIFAMRAVTRSSVWFREPSITKSIPFSGQDAGFDLTGGFSDGDVGLNTTAQSGTNPAA